MRRNFVLRHGTVSLLALTALALLAAGAQADPPTSGYVGLRWSDCYGDGGSDSHSFACDTNTGVDILVVSAFPTVDMPQVASATVFIQVLTTGTSLPNWWQFGSSACRSGPPSALSVNFIPPPTSTHCLDLWQGSASGGSAFIYPFDSDADAQIEVVCAPPASIAVAAGTEIFIARIAVTHPKTVGTGACGGCQTGLCLGANFVRLEPPAQGSAFFLLDPLPGTSSDVVGWQMSGAVMPSYIYYSPSHYERLFTACQSPTEATRPTWGAIKRLYR